MEKFTYLNNADPVYIENLYTQFKTNPDDIDLNWRKFFEGMEFAQTALSSNGTSTHLSDKDVAVVKLINAYRSRGHLIAKTNPIRERRAHKADLELDYFGLNEGDLDETFDVSVDIGLPAKQTLREIVSHLEKTYCGSIGVEFMDSPNHKLRQWMQAEMEPIANKAKFSLDDKKHTLKKIMQAVTFESFLQTKYVGKKRFSLEGLESLIPAMDAAIEQGAEMGCREFVLGMAHRGRLNVLANIFGKTYEDVFSEFEGTLLPEDIKGEGDVKYHLGQSADIQTEHGHKVRITLRPNPSHLEAVNPVVQGVVYGKKLATHDGDNSKIIPILVHGDAAIAGQGVNYEVVNISKVEGYQNGGTVHIVLNNQLGFTTGFKEARSSVYCTDIAKITASPVFHVNGDDPEAVVHAVQMAIKIRQKFQIDVYVDILGYRRYGHNEGDEPRFTQPILYKRIEKHPTILNVFIDHLIEAGDITAEEAKQMNQEFKAMLQEKLDFARQHKPEPKINYLKRDWRDFRVASAGDFDQSPETGVKKAMLNKITKALTEIPDSVNLYSKMTRLIKQRSKLLIESKSVDWALGELMAYGSLLTDGHGVRLSGQDVQRGTFSHRHCVIKDFESGQKYIPLNHIAKNQKQLTVYNSILSEYCILGFEYGYSLAQPQELVIWEAQFGDFSNGAQIIIDQFISSAEVKWQRMSGVVLLLPHGYEGQGPEHSSARPERYLQLCAQNNMVVANATTPANFYHLLRRQVKQTFRIPLVVFTPKSLLRHPKVISPISDLEKGRFQEIIDDGVVAPSKAKRVVLCTGKIYYELADYRENKKIKDVVILRLEQMYPLAYKQLDALKKRYKSAEWVWVQEEPENMGAWSHVMRHLKAFNLSCVSRAASASPATGQEKSHQITQQEVVEGAFRPIK